jgi:transcriptional regulator with XRE-family HTH domain
MNNMNHEPIPNILKEQRKKAGLTQLQVAQYLGFKSTDRISRWETGLTYPHVLNLLKLAKLFGVKAEDLYSEN